MHNERLFGLFTGKFCFSQNASAFKDVRFPFNLCVGILFVKFHLSCRHHFVQHSAGSHWQRKTRLRTFQQNNGPCNRSIFLFILQILVIRTGNIVVPLGKNFGFTDVAIKNGLLLVLRLTGATLPLSILISVTNLNDLSDTMVKNLGVPYKYAFTLTSAIRFIPVFSIEMSNIIDSQKARGIDFEIKNPFKKLSMILPLCFPLLISSVRKIEATATAAELRGFYLRTRQSCSKEYSLHLSDAAFILIGFAVLAGGIFL